MDIRVGDLVTYKNSMGNIRQVVIKDEEQKIKYINNVNTYKNILKIERPKYEVVEEKKELLTEEEKEFLKYMCKYYPINSIWFFDNYISLRKNDIPQLSPAYPENIKFTNVEKWREYTIKELGLEEK